MPSCEVVRQLSVPPTEREEDVQVQSFVGVAVDEKAPDPSTLTAFKARLKANGREKALKEVPEHFYGYEAHAG